MNHFRPGMYVLHGACPYPFGVLCCVSVSFRLHLAGEDRLGGAIYK